MKLIETGKQLGMEGDGLIEFATMKEKDQLDRDERAREREREREEREREREEREREREERERERAEKEREREEKQRQRLHEEKLEEMRSRRHEENVNSSNSVQAFRPKLPKFNEEKDDIDAYIERFERFAAAQGWPEEEWAQNLSFLLCGKALEVYSSLPEERIDNFVYLKKQLLMKFQLSAECFRQKFRNAKPEKNEMVSQFVNRINRYLDRWVELSDASDNVKDLKDLLLREQFLNGCSSEMSTFVKERSPKCISDLVELAEQYSEAHTNISSRPRKFYDRDRHVQNGQLINRSVPLQYASSNMNNGNISFEEKRCYCCNMKGHLAKNCFYGRNQRKSYPDRDVTYGRDNLRTTQHPHYKNQVSDTSRGHTQQNAFCGVEVEKAEDTIHVETVTDTKILMMSNDDGIGQSSGRLVTSRGYINGTEVNTLRDTGCTGVIARKELVHEKNFTGRIAKLELVNGTTIQCPIGKAFIDSPYFVGETEVMCLDTPTVELIIGNVPNATIEKNPDWCVVEEREIIKAAKAEQSSTTEKDVGMKIDAVKLEAAQIADKTLEKLWQYAKEKKVLKTRGDQPYQFEIISGLLYRVYSQTRGEVEKKIKQVVVPVPLRAYVMQLAHESLIGGHLATKKTLDRITSSFHWPGISGDVSRFCRSCDVCQRMSPKRVETRAPLGTMPLMNEPFERVSIDLIGPINPVSNQGNKYILTVVDFATRYPEAIALPNIETETIAEALFGVFSRIGFPKEILSDRGAQFTSGIMNEVCRLISVKQKFTSPYNPRCNGLCERINGVLKSMLRKMCAECPREWDRYLPAILFAYREVPQASTGFSPFELLYGRTVRGPMQILQQIWTETQDDVTRNTYEYVFELRNRLEETCKLARESLNSAQGNYKHHYDRKARARSFNIGEKVLILTHKKDNRLFLEWKGPCKISGKMNALDYVINVNGKNKIFHINLLRKYHEREVENSIPEEVALAIAVVGGDEDDESYFEDNNLLEALNMKPTETWKDVKIDESLNDIQQTEVKRLLSEFRDIFNILPGESKCGSHSIKLRTDEPIHVKQYPVPYAKNEIIKKEIENMTKWGIIEPSNSPYNSPIVLVLKKDNSHRFCIDFRKLNAVTEFDSEPMGDQKQILSKLKDDCHFTKLDFSKGFWQIKLEDSARPMTAFSTSEGSFQFRRMPFGLINSGATFNRAMRKVLKGINHVDNYVDDVLVHNNDWNSHLDTLRETFQRIREAGMTLRASKCEIGRQKIEYIGHIVGEGQIEMDPVKAEKVKNADRPTTKTQVRSFLGLTGYFREYIPRYAEIAKPLTDLTKKGQPNIVEWTACQEESFQNLKLKMSEAPILRLPDFTKPFILQTDGSNTGIGAALLQDFHDGRFPIAYASKKLLPRERNYSTIEIECLAIVFGIKKFQKYLHDTNFELHTDHRPLSYIQKCKIESPRIMRWALFLQNFSFRIVAIKGSENLTADYLSRQFL